MADVVRLEGLTLSVADVKRSIAFYRDKLGFVVEIDKPHFALIRVGGPRGGTIGLLSSRYTGGKRPTRAGRAAISVELGTDRLDALYEKLRARGVVFHEPPHDEPW